METFFPIDNSFFAISFDGDAGVYNINEDVIELSIDEEVQKMTTGAIKLKDTYGIYARQFSNGKTFSLSWGYKRGGINYAKALVKNPLEITGSAIRTALKCYIQSPGGSGATDGVRTYNCNFYAAEMQSNLKDTIWYRTGIKKTVIQSAMASLGATETYIDFIQQNDVLGEDNAVLQNETYYKFLVRLAYEWKCTFKLAYNNKGLLIGLFVDNSSVDGLIAQSFQKSSIGGTTGSSKLFEYGINSQYPNVISYTWKHNIGDSGLGDGNKIEIINGAPVVTNYTVEDQVVKISRLNEGRLKEYVKTHPDQKELLSDIIAANSLTSTIGTTTVSYFFDETETKTAPQGLGYSAELNVIGDPLLTPTIKATLGNGFPDMFKNDVGGLNKFYIHKVKHTLNANGYKCTVSVADTLTIFGSFVA